MTLESLRLIRNILLRSTVVGLVLAIIIGIATFAGWHAWMKLAIRLFHTDQATIAPIVLQFFSEIRFFLLFILLTPALGIHWTVKKELAPKA